MSPATSPVDPAKWRDRFPILADTTYLVTHSLGAMPSGVFDKLQAYAEQWATRGVRSWAEGWWTAPIDVGNVLGKIMNAPAGSVAMHQNVSIIQSILASCFDFSGPRNKVVYTDQNFPTVMYVWEGCKQYGARIVNVPTPTTGDHAGIGVPTEQLLEAIDEQTLVVPISHVCFKSSYLQDAKAIIDRAHEVGALVVLDTYQSLGTVPVDVQALDVDIVCGGSVKWLCGGPGAGYLYVRPDLLPRLNPRITGWAAHAAPFAFEQGEQRYADSMMKMLHGSPAVPSLVAATAGYETILEVGVESIRAHSIALTETLREDLGARGFRVPSPLDPGKRGGSLIVGLNADEDGPAFVSALEARGVLVDHRPNAGIRVSPHFYTSAEELAVFAEHLTELRETRSWQDFLNVASAY
ncbi:MAG: aminotransferase class V-fold PLP-dependent enzyme [Planctomycetota bacterium]|nr:aminotransferase class V-fold PLP-dependent enzyme [Planctomycetota bacterium]